MWTESPRKKWANAEFPLVVFPQWSFFKNLPRGGQTTLAVRGHLSSCSAALKIASLRGSKEVKESREPAYDGCSCPHTDGLQLWAGNQRLNRVPMHFCKAQHLHGHPPSAAPTVWFEACELQPWLKERRALLQPPAIHLPQKMPSGKFSLPHSTKQQRNFISSKIRYVSCKNRFWNRKRLIITL